MRTDLPQQFAGLVQIRLGLGVGVQAEIAQSGGKHLLDRVQHMHAAVRELLELVGIEQDLPAVDHRVRAEPLPDLGDVVADPGGAPHVVHGVLVAGVVFGQPPLDLGPGVLEIGHLGGVDRRIEAERDVARQEGGGDDDQVVAGLARQQLGFDRLHLVEGVVDDRDPGLLLEGVENLGVDIVGPVVDAQFLALRSSLPRHGQRQAQRETRDDSLEPAASHHDAFDSSPDGRRRS